jgi:site-specific recombinase XerC
MGQSEFDPGYNSRKPWNAGKLVGPKRAFKPKQVWAIRFHLDREKNLRDLALFDLSIDSKLRGCDLVKLKIGDLVAGGQIKSRAMIVQQKTGKPVQFEIMEPVRSSLKIWLERRGGTLVDEWVEAVGLGKEEYGTHSLRRTKASIIYKRTGNLRAVQILLGHTKIENTVRYLGVDIEDALELSEGTEI